MLVLLPKCPLRLLHEIRDKVKADIIGDCISRLLILPYFAAAGYNILYAKSALYSQKMQQLPENHPDIHINFLKGYYAKHRWVHIVFEQFFMRSIKIWVGGGEEGRGVK